jgi:hypothetical protein
MGESSPRKIAAAGKNTWRSIAVSSTIINLSDDHRSSARTSSALAISKQNAR